MHMFIPESHKLPDGHENDAGCVGGAAAAFGFASAGMHIFMLASHELPAGHAGGADCVGGDTAGAGRVALVSRCWIGARTDFFIVAVSLGMHMPMTASQCCRRGQ